MSITGRRKTREGMAVYQGRHPRATTVLSSALILGLVIGGAMNLQANPVSVESEATGCRFPTIPDQHPHARALLANAMRYVAPESGTVDPVSGYPVEGWNQEPCRGLCLKSFTQLTAIGQWMELLAHVAAGYADTPHLSREQALKDLQRVVASLRHDQKDPQVSARGLLGNFLDLSPAGRRGPLASDVEKRRFLEAFGKEKAEDLWQALLAKGWIVPQGTGAWAAVHRKSGYGDGFFDGPLAPFADEATRRSVMAILDQRVVTVAFGDNANLTTSVGKAIGMLLLPAIKDRPEIQTLRRDLDAFLDAQRDGYTFLYDARAGLFRFGWDATRDRPLGWEDGQGNWQPGHMDYLVNEFRGPSTFVILRYGLPADALGNLGFKIKGYQPADGAAAYVLAPWEGSAFQALGLGLSMMELSSPAWRKILENVVEIELDYAHRKQLPGFLSESYTGEGFQYTGDVGIPEIAVNAMPRITHAASLYTLGVAYMIAPDRVERFLARNWPMVSKLLTDHGPWEGYNTIRGEPIRIQTTAHTMALALGLLQTGSENMARYLDSKHLSLELAKLYQPGKQVDFLSGPTRVFAWTDSGSSVKSTREASSLRVQGSSLRRFGVAFVSSRREGENLSNGVLSIRYRSQHAIMPAVIAFKSVQDDVAAPKISKELFTRFAATKGEEVEIQVPLPATPGLTAIKELVITSDHGTGQEPVELSITRFDFTPFAEGIVREQSPEKPHRPATETAPPTAVARGA